MSDRVGDDPIPRAGGGPQGLSTSRLRGVLDGTYVPLFGRIAAARRLLNQLKPSDYSSFALSSDVPTVTVGASATITARVIGPQTGEVTEVGSRGLWSTSAGRQGAGAGGGLDFFHRGTAVEIAFFSGLTGTLPVWIFVDGQPTTAAPDTTSVGAVTINSTYYVKLTFGASRRRRIEFYAPHSGAWYSVRCGLTDMVEPAPRRPVVAWVGDSFYAGSNASSVLASAPMLASRQLGVESLLVSQGGTGYVNAGAFQTYGDPVRVAIAGRGNPDLIVFQGSVNDDGQSGIGAAATATYAAYRAACPNASFIVLGSQPTTATSTLSANRSANIAAVKAAALADPSVIGFHDMVGTASGVPAAAATFQTYADGTLMTRLGAVWKVSNGGAAYTNGPTIPPTDAHFELKTWGYYGTGQVGATTSDGTRDLYLYSDGVHPTPEASQAFADMTVAKIRADLMAFATAGTVTAD